MILIAIVAGLIVGSFLTVFVDRLRDGRNFVNARSTCDSCHKKLSALDLVPLFSWLLLQGRCRHCRQPVSYYYPMVELATATVFGLFYLLWPYSYEGWDLVLLLGWIPILTGFLALIIYDLRWWILPNKIIYPLFLWSLLLLAVHALAQMSFSPFLGALLSMLAGGGLFYLVFQLSSQHIGGGDVKLGFWLGLLLLRWELSIMMIFLSSIIGTIVALPALVRRRQRRLKMKIPFGPFLILATLLVFWFGELWLEWYLALVRGA